MIQRYSKLLPSVILAPWEQSPLFSLSTSLSLLEGRKNKLLKIHDSATFQYPHECLLSSALDGCSWKVMTNKCKCIVPTILNRQSWLDVGRLPLAVGAGVDWKLAVVSQYVASQPLSVAHESVPGKKLE